jgi:hypothetical protein
LRLREPNISGEPEQSQWKPNSQNGKQTEVNVSLFGQLKRVFGVIKAAVFAAVVSTNSFAVPGDIDFSYGAGGIASVEFPNRNLKNTKLLTRRSGSTVGVAECTQGTPPYDFDTKVCVFQLTEDGEIDEAFGLNGFGIYAGPVGSDYFRPIAAKLQRTGNF